MNRDTVPDRPQRLPRQVPLSPGESPESFLRRLATANHLRPSYLRTYLSSTPGTVGGLHVSRLAAVTGRTTDELTRVMPALRPAEPGPPPRTPRPTDPTPVPREPHDPAALPAALRRAADADETVNRLSRQFAVPRRTIIRALTNQTGPRHHNRSPWNNPALNHVAGHLDHLIAQNPTATIWSIWQQLQAEQALTVSYWTVRNYVNRARADPADTASAQFLLSRAELFTAIRAHAAGHDLITALASQFLTDPAVVAQALTGRAPEPATPKAQGTYSNPILDRLRPHIDQMITTDPDITIVSIWQRLVDDHHAETSYHTVRDYVSREHRQHSIGSRTRRGPNSDAP
ncbi:hypothetical protein [Micromonospora zamorensis]|uniref:TniQ protein n=1 Tax=Micromonospora zamorensis TaxID=709883 RepID=A0ABZ1PIR0_9ACTN